MPLKTSTSPRQEYADYYNSPEYYEEIITKLKNPLPKRKVKTIIADFNLGLREMMVEDGFEWNIFGNLGKMAVYKYRPEIKRKENGQLTLPINRLATYKLWQEKPELKHKKWVYHMNEHTDGYVVKIVWYRFKKYGMKKNAELLTFAPVARFSWHVNEAIMKRRSHENYFIFEKFNFR